VSSFCGAASSGDEKSTGRSLKKTPDMIKCPAFRPLMIRLRLGHSKQKIFRGPNKMRR
jgi:hypothetical protein